MPVSFADLSHHQASVNLAAYKAAGHDRVILKCTEGTGFVDPQFATRWRSAGSLGLARVAYHYARARFHGAAEFSWYISQVRAAGGLTPRDRLCLDVEDTQTPTSARANAAQFTNAAAAAGHTEGLVYTGRWYADPNGITAAVFPAGWRRLWLSDYTPGQADGAVEVPAGWARGQIVARQHTDKATVAGVGTPCDYNRVLVDWLTGQGRDDEMSAAEVAELKAEFRAAIAALGRKVDEQYNMLTRATPQPPPAEADPARYRISLIGLDNRVREMQEETRGQLAAVKGELQRQIGALHAAVEALPPPQPGQGPLPLPGPTDLAGQVRLTLSPLGEVSHFSVNLASTDDTPSEEPTPE